MGAELPEIGSLDGLLLASREMARRFAEVVH
jgi:hypothetical protein